MHEQVGLSQTLRDLLEDASRDPFVLWTARTLIERVSSREEKHDGVHDRTMRVA